MIFTGHFSLILVCILFRQIIASKSEIEEEEEEEDSIVSVSSSSAISSQLANVANIKIEEPQQIVSSNADGNIQMKKVSPERMECIADYLVKFKGAKTEIFAEKENNKWRMKRAIVRQQDLLKELKVYERDMAKEIGVYSAKRCLIQNKALLNSIHEPVTSNAQAKKSAELNIWKLFDRSKSTNFFKICELFDRSANGRLQVSDGMNKKLEEQSDCLAKFLARNFGMEHLHIEQIGKTTDSENEFAILKANRMKWNWLNKELVRWKWAGEEEEMPEIRIEKGTPTPYFNALKKCHEILPVKDGIHKGGTSENPTFIKLNPMLKRFRDDQMFVNSGTRENKIFKIDHLRLVMQKEKRCSVCLQNFMNDNEVEQLYPCKHVFHKECIEPWLKNQHSCPNCRGNNWNDK